MPLTTRTNGSSSPNIIQSSWFNDFKDLLTGVMVDQEVSIKNNLAMLSLGAPPSAACSGALAASTVLGIGVYKYVYTYVSADGESTVSPTFTITTTSGNQKVNLTGITVGPSGTTARKVYRTAVGGSSFKLLTTISDNSTTTFSDAIADGSLGLLIPGYNSFGGTLLTKDSGGTVRGGIASDGTVILTPSPVLLTGGTAGTAELYQWMQGTLKTTWIILNGFRTAGVDQFFTLPSPYTKAVRLWSQGTLTWAVMTNGAAQTVSVFGSGASGGSATVGNSTNVFADNQGFVVAAIDQVRLNSGWASNKDGIIILEGK